MKIKKISALIIAVIMLLSFASCTIGDKTPKATNTQINITMLKGPTGIGAVKLMSDSDAGNTLNKYTFSLSSDPTDISGGIVNGSIDIAACPLNLASVLYKKTNGNVQMLAINTLGTLYIVSKDPTITKLADLEGKTIVTAGQGATPEYVLNYLLEKNGLNDKVTVEYKSEHAEVATLALSGEADTVLLPEPNVTAVLSKSEDFAVAVDLSKEFENVSGVSLAMGCIIARKDFVENNKAAVDAFLYEYKNSIEYVANDIDGASSLCEAYGIIPKAAVAKKAIPNCHISYLSGEDMKKTANENLTVLFNANPSSVGGELPKDDFWYNAK